MGFGVRASRAASVLGLALLLSCSRDDRPSLIVFAAASLREAFEAVEQDFVRDHPGVRVRFNFAGSQELRRQLEHGAQADVFASADWRQMRPLAQAGLVSQPQVFACNELVLIVPRGNPGKVTGLADLTRVERLVLAAPEVPAGAYTRKLLETAAADLGPDFPALVESRVVSQELSVRQVLTKVRLGEADAGIVYRTDAFSADLAVDQVQIPRRFSVGVAYTIATLSNGPQRHLGSSWVARLERSHHLLAQIGFVPCISLELLPN